MKGPVGKCRYCGAEFMSRGGLANHEQKICPERPQEQEQEQAPVEEPERKPRFRQAVRIGNGIGWVRE